MQPEELNPLAATIKYFVGELDSSGIDWCVLRNYEFFPLPRSIESDLDILAGCDIKGSLALLCRAAAANRVRLRQIVTRNAYTLSSIDLLHPDYGCMHVDLHADLTWRGIPIVDREMILAHCVEYQQTRIPTRGHEVAVSLLTYLLHNGRVKCEYRAQLGADVEGDTESFVACLDAIWGSPIARHLANRLTARDWLWFESWVPSARQYLLYRTLRNPTRGGRIAFGTLMTALDRIRNAATR